MRYLNAEKPVTFVCNDKETVESVTVWLKDKKATTLPLHPSQVGLVLEGGKTYILVQLSNGTFVFEEELAGHLGRAGQPASFT